MEEENGYDNGLKVTENEDKSFTIEWNENDSRWAWLSELSEEEATKLLTNTIENYLQELIDEEEKKKS